MASSRLFTWIVYFRFTQWERFYRSCYSFDLPGKCKLFISKGISFNVNISTWGGVMETRGGQGPHHHPPLGPLRESTHHRMPVPSWYLCRRVKRTREGVLILSRRGGNVRASQKIQPFCWTLNFVIWREGGLPGKKITSVSGAEKRHAV